MAEVNSRRSTDDCKSSKISIRVIRNHLKTYTMCKHAAKKLPFEIRYVPDQCKTQQMRNKAIL